MAEGGGYNWDPTNEPVSQPSKEAIETILRERKYLKDGHEYPCVKIYFDEDDMTKVHVLILGQLYTPYARGFFYFLVRFPPDYPQQPPKVKLMNTGGGRVRFNPNIYKTGMVCHSLLGTWEGASWDADYNNLSDILAVITRTLNENPYENEPLINGKFPEFRKGDSKRYNDVIRHETLRVAVCDMMDGTVDMPEPMRKEITKRFLCNYKQYIQMCKDHKNKDGDAIKDSDPFFNVNRELIEEEIFKRSAEELVAKLNLALANFLRDVQLNDRTKALIHLVLIHNGVGQYSKLLRFRMAAVFQSAREQDPFFKVDRELLEEAGFKLLGEELALNLNLALANFLLDVHLNDRTKALIHLVSIHNDAVRLQRALHIVRMVAAFQSAREQSWDAESSTGQSDSSNFNSETGPNLSFPEESLRHRTESRPSSSQTGTEPDTHQPGIGTGLPATHSQTAGNDGVPKVVNFNDAREGNFDYKNILKRIQDIKSNLDKTEEH